MPLNAEECFIAYAATVYRWALAFCGRHAEAQDITQDVFLRMTQRPPLLPNAAAAVAWLRRATTSAAIDRWRRRSSQAPSPRPASAAQQAPALVAHERDERVRQALATLSEQQRIVLLCKVYDEMTFQEIAGELGVATPTVKTHYLRGLEALSRALGSSDDARTI